MPEFILDHGSPETARQFRNLDSFTQDYIEAMFFTDEERLCEESGQDRESYSDDQDRESYSSGHVTFADLAPATLARIIADCERFQTANAALLELAYARPGYGDESAGRDFWYTRNGHGVGYWDRKELEPESAEYEALTAEMVANRDNNAAWSAALAKRKVLQSASLGEQLSTAAREFHGVDSYVGDDGLIYLS